MKKIILSLILSLSLFASAFAQEEILELHLPSEVPLDNHLQNHSFEEHGGKSLAELMQLFQVVLAIEERSITSIPEEVRNLTGLAGLGLIFNKLTTVPAYIGQLTKLRTLSFAFNQLTTLPNELGSLTNLEFLALQNNELRSLPATIGHLVKLKLLSANNNKLTQLPEQLGSLTNLETLYLQENGLTALPITLGNLTNLKTLDVQKNKLSSLPKCFDKLSNLNVLTLRGNELTVCPDALTALTKLRVLNLSDNELSTIPLSIYDLSNLTELYMHQTAISKLDPCIAQLVHLKTLVLSFNNLSALPRELNNISRLEILDLEGNHFSHPSFPLDESGSVDAGMPQGEISLRNNLKELDLAHIGIQEIPSSISQFRALTWLNLSNNELSTLPDELGSIPLKFLYVKNNKLTGLPAALKNIKSLEHLCVANNLLVALPEDLFDDMPNFESLVIENNPSLASLPLSLTRLSKLEFLALVGCKLRLAGLTDFAQEKIAYLEGFGSDNAQLKEKRKALSAFLTKLFHMKRLAWFDAREHVLRQENLRGDTLERLYIVSAYLKGMRRDGTQVDEITDAVQNEIAESSQPHPLAGRISQDVQRHINEWL